MTLLYTDIVAERGAADGARCAQVLALGTCSSGHAATRGEGGEAGGIGATLTGGSHRRGVSAPGRRREDDSNIVAGTLKTNRTGYSGQDTYTGQVIASTLRAGGHGHPGVKGDEANQSNLVVGKALPSIEEQECVRRLTPLERERLQGWPDDWTRWDALGGELTVSARDRLTGNGVVATVAEWLGHRLVETHRLSLTEAVA